MDDLGRRVKKLVQQNRFTLTEIARICKTPIEDCANAYENYTGKKILASFLIAGNEQQKKNLKNLILKNQKILLFGSHGVGKSSLPRIIAHELNWRIVYSYPRNSDDLVKDFADVPFKVKNTIFVIEADSFYWRSYAVINHYIQSKCPVIIIVTEKDTVNKNVLKSLVKLKIQSPNKKDIEIFIRKKYPDWTGNIDDVYNKDMRITLRKIRFGIDSYKLEKEEHLDSQQVAYKIMDKKCTQKDIENCLHPFIFILNWLGNNAYNFYNDMQVLDDISFVDAHKYNLKKKYLNGMLLNIPRKQKRARMFFPPIKFKPPKKKEIDWEKRKIRRKKIQQIVTKISTDMVL